MKKYLIGFAAGIALSAAVAAMATLTITFQLATHDASGHLHAANAHYNSWSYNGTVLTVDATTDVLFCNAFQQ